MLKYLFVAKFADGTEIRQNQRDTSKKDPKRSQYWDVLNSKLELVEFEIGRLFDRWSVNLKTGVFSHNRQRFQLEENLKPEKREIVFFRQHQHDMNASGDELDHRIKYFLGYKVRNKKFTIGIN